MPQFAVPLLVVSLAATAASAGISYYGQQQQAAAAEGRCRQVPKPA